MIKLIFFLVQDGQIHFVQEGPKLLKNIYDPGCGVVISKNHGNRQVVLVVEDTGDKDKVELLDFNTEGASWELLPISLNFLRPGIHQIPGNTPDGTIYIYQRWYDDTVESASVIEVTILGNGNYTLKDSDIQMTNHAWNAVTISVPYNIIQCGVDE